MITFCGNTTALYEVTLANIAALEAIADRKPSQDDQLEMLRKSLPG